MEEQKPGQTISPKENKPSHQEKPTEPPSQWQFNAAVSGSDEAHKATSPANKPTASVAWSASEFIAHHKSASWYIGLAVAALIVAAVIFLLTHDKISTGVIVLAAVVLGIFGARKPRVLNYKLDGAGLNIGQKFYDYNLFKSFAVIEEGAFSSIILMPMKRFMPSLSLYYAPDDENKIVDILAERLPFENRKQDAVDSFMRRIRF